MTEHIDYQIISNRQTGEPEYVVIPYKDFVEMESEVADIPHEVVGLIILKRYTPLRAWREYLGFTQEEMANKLGISQPAYQKRESSRKLSLDIRKQCAEALGVKPRQLDLVD